MIQATATALKVLPIAASHMIDAGLVISVPGVVSGYRFGVVRVLNNGNFVVAAIPDTSGAGRYAYYTTEDGIVRYSTIDSLTPIGQSGAPVQSSCGLWVVRKSKPTFPR